MATQAEKTLINRRRAAASEGVLVPLLERLLEVECIPEDEEDFRFMDMLVRARSLPRRKGVFSPSMLGSCQRQAWFAKRGTEKHMPQNAQTNGYFVHGNFIHFKWQFAMWKAHRAGLLELARVPIGHEIDIIYELAHKKTITELDAKAWMESLNFYSDATRPGVEVRVVDGDYGGTIDVLPVIESLYYIVDFKGVNLIDFQRTVKNGAKQEYRKQIVGYGKIAAKVLDIEIEECLLVSECKAGPQQGAGRGGPLALHETRVRVEDFEGEVARRLRTLRHHDAKNRMPAPECVSTQHMSFQECAFQRFCRDEVLIVQREREAQARKRSAGKEPSVARSRR